MFSQQVADPPQSVSAFVAPEVDRVNMLGRSFVVNTVQFLNKFSSLCEEKLNKALLRRRRRPRRVDDLVAS